MLSSDITEPAEKRSMPDWPSFSQIEAARVAQILLSNKVNYWTGDEGRAFEREFADFIGTRHGIAMANGTVVLEAALKALGVGPGDEVIVTPRTFFASISCVVAVGAIPVFADIDRDTQNISVATIEPVLTEKTRAIICVHLAGWPCDMVALNQLADAHGVAVIEDCAQAHGATIDGKSVGGFGRVGCWSFCQDKIMTTGGEGGMVTTDDEELWQAMWSLKDHGKSFDAVYNREHPPGFRWLHESFGTNWRLTEMQSAIGRLQLQWLPEWADLRLDYAERIWNAASHMPGLRVPEIPANIRHAAYRCYIFVEPEKLNSGWDRDRIVSELSAIGVQVMQGSCSEVYLEKAFEGSGYGPTHALPVAAELGDTSVMFKIHPNLSGDDIDWVITRLEDVMKLAAGGPAMSQPSRHFDNATT